MGYVCALQGHDEGPSLLKDRFGTWFQMRFCNCNLQVSSVSALVISRKCYSGLIHVNLWHEVDAFDLTLGST